MSSGFPVNVTSPVVIYLTTLGLVEMVKLKLSVTWSVPFFCSSSLALTSKNSSSLGIAWPVLSACKLLSVIETLTPETEYCGLTADPSLYSFCDFIT